MTPSETLLRKKKLSIITICLNAEHTLFKTLQSIEFQTYSNIEVIVCDGGSIDNSKQLFDHWKSNVINSNCPKHLVDSSIIWINQSSIGIYAAMNEAVMFATGDIITFLNANDTFENPHVCEVAMQWLEINQSLSAVYGNVKIEGSNWWKCRHINSKNWRPWMLFWGFMAPQPGLFVRHAAFFSVGKFVESFQIAGDFEWLLRFHLKQGLISQWVRGITIKMTYGGVSSSGLWSLKVATIEMRRAFRLNGFNLGYWRFFFRFPLKSFGVLRALIK